ncbi:MAG: glycosyltransferase family 2 protein [Candidatus Nanopelagicales bacterium]
MRLPRATAWVRAVVWATTALTIAGAVHAASNSKNLRHLRPGRRQDAGALPAVSILVPARDEQATIDGCLEMLRAQRGLAATEIIVLDDDSSDDTADLARHHAESDPRVRVISGHTGPPPGWLGKPYACHRLAAAASGEVLVFVDADVRLHPEAVAAAVADLVSSRSDLLSAWPRQLAATHLARMVQPLQQWSWLTTLPLARAATSARSSMAAANGQFLLLTREGYDTCGGHGAVAGEVLEDIGLARAVKRSGGRADVVDAAAVAQCLMYADNRELVAGYTKSLWRAFGGPVSGVAVTATLAIGHLLPPGYALVGQHRETRIVGLVGYCAAVAGRIVAARSTGSAAWPSAAEHPAAMVALFALTVRSAALSYRGGLQWRGRPVGPRVRVHGALR